MNSFPVGYLKLVAVVLIGFTFLSVLSAERLASQRLTIEVIFGAAALKSLIVMSRFMEIGRVAGPWRFLFPLWACAMTLMLVAGHLYR
jgi:heme/copper-type cytochrome/quinol oxidase subunit 4